jgi:hypothetical protein
MLKLNTILPEPVEGSLHRATNLSNMTQLEQLTVGVLVPTCIWVARVINHVSSWCIKDMMEDF